MVLERYLASHLTSLLGEYFEESCFSRQNLSLGAWSGTVVLENLVLKPTALDALDLPLALRRGSIGRLQLEIPWSRLGSKPLTVVA